MAYEDFVDIFFFFFFFGGGGGGGGGSSQNWTKVWSFLSSLGYLFWSRYRMGNNFLGC